MRSLVRLLEHLPIQSCRMNKCLPFPTHTLPTSQLVARVRVQSQALRSGICSCLFSLMRAPFPHSLATSAAALLPTTDRFQPPNPYRASSPPSVRLAIALARSLLHFSHDQSPPRRRRVVCIASVVPRLHEPRSTQETHRESSERSHRSRSRSRTSTSHHIPPSHTIQSLSRVVGD